MTKLYEVVLYQNDGGFFRLGYFTDEYLDTVKEQLTKVYKFLQGYESEMWYMQSSKDLSDLTGIPQTMLMCKFLDACIHSLPEDWLYSKVRPDAQGKVKPEYEEKALKTIFYQTIKQRAVNKL